MILKIYNVTEINSSKLYNSIKQAAAVENYEKITYNQTDSLVYVHGDLLLDESALDSIFSNHVAFDLTQYKVEKMLSIDDRTAELIELGYSYNSKQFSLSINAQTNILALFATKDNPALTYPIKHNTKNDTETIDLINASNVESMYLSALATKKAHLDSGTALKEQVRSAVDKAGVDAVIDNR